MNRYELTYIINTALEETARKELIEKFTELIKQNGGEIEKVDESWGKRRLAYPIDDMPEGYYVLTTFTASGSQNKEIQRNLEINDMILRYLIIKLLDKKQSVKPKPIRTVSAPPAEDDTTPKQEADAEAADEADDEAAESEELEQDGETLETTEEVDAEQTE